ncbi:helix-turn-helix transcriptional regulator [Geomonas silvestris]|uniref:helix-turn-helix transcriptional regulator n=1 Tax=Geomonas silvestris TaxID=2740184 RepID=UPI001611171F
MLTKTTKKIKKLLVDADVSQSDIARMAGVDRSAINHVIAGRGKSPRLRIFVARALGVSIEELWPNKPDTRKRKAA